MTPKCGDIADIMNRKEALGHARGVLYPGLQGLGMLISPRNSRRTLSGEKGCLGSFVSSAPSTTHSWVSGE